MGWRWTPVAGLTLVGAAFFLVAAAYVWRRRGSSSSSAAATSLVLMLLATTEWSLTYIVELTATDLAVKELWGDPSTSASSCSARPGSRSRSCTPGAGGW
jgi:hypothetical protein